ncbi:golgi apyrase [Entomortierella parvispora]|uniref:Golgi apyrase n=1 Tax=Entomortierella parvispora TaxID=205924 RepID=A0A9P3M1T4_9FUNG|nr:golgi apyrase [Entomortierella parvispora]
MASNHSEAWLKNRHFGIVIDAGSSGSRIHIYSWIDRAHLQENTPFSDLRGVLPTIEPGVESGAPNSVEWTKKTDPGIAEFKDRPEDVGEHLEPLLDHALKIIPESQIANTPIYLLATAGLRLVKDDVREKILANSCQYIKDNYNFALGACKDHIRNISGQEEGIYGWVAINYLMGGFDKGGVKMINLSDGSEQHDSSDSDSLPPSYDNEDGDDPSSQSHRHTLGFLDMGGASTQIAFEPSPKASEEHANDLTAVSLRTLDGESMQYNVFVTTFLGYGSNQARRRYVKDYLLPPGLEHEPETVIEDPCLPKNLELSETHTQPHVNLKGTGSFLGCLKRVEALLNKDKECYDIPCLFNGVHTPPIDFNINTFIGVSEYWYSSHDILGLGGAYDYAEFERKSAEFCSTGWEDIKDRPEYEGQTQERLEMQCFKSAWLSNVLHEGFGLPRYGEKGAIGSKEQSNEVLEKAEESIKNKNWRPPFQSINAIKDIQVTWTLGAMLLISSGSMGSPGAGAGTGLGGTTDHGHRPTEQALPPAEQRPPHEDSYPERMLDNYNHFMLLAIVVFGLAVFYVYRSRSSKPWLTIRRWLNPGGSSLSPGGGNNGGLPLFGRFRRTSGPSGPDYSSLESGTVGGSYGGRSFSPRASLKVFYLSVVHHTRSVWWSLTSRIWPEPSSFDNGARGTEEMMESITIAGFDGSSATMPMSGIGGASGNAGISHHGGTPVGSLGSLGLSAIPELGSGVGSNGSGGSPGPFEGGYHRSQSSMSNPSPGSRPPKTTPRFFRINKKRFSGDSQSLLAAANNTKDGRVANVEGCVVNTALLQKQPHLQSAVELTARSGNSSSQSNNGWKQGWIPEEDAPLEDSSVTPMPSMLTSSRSFNAVSMATSGSGSVGGQSPLLTPMARYKQQQLVHQDGSSSAPTSSVNLSGYGGFGGNGGHSSGFASGFVTSADERDEWSADGGDGDDEGEGYMDRQHTSHSASGGLYGQSSGSKTSFQQYQQQVQYNQQQYSSYPVRSASAVPFSDNNPNHTGRYKHRANGILSGINFESGGGAMTSLDDGQESASEAGYLSGASSTGAGGRRSSGGLMPLSVRGLGSRSASPMPMSAPQLQQQQQMFNLQHVSTSTSSLVLGRHNLTEQDQQLTSRGSSENVRRGSQGTVMSP